MKKGVKNRLYDLMKNFKVTFSCKGMIAKMYLRNNIKENDFQFQIKPNYKNKSIIIKFTRKK